MEQKQRRPITLDAKVDTPAPEVQADARHRRTIGVQHLKGPRSPNDRRPNEGIDGGRGNERDQMPTSVHASSNNAATDRTLAAILGPYQVIN